jgi:outer membrane lipopolysaccharide assembly protein LptE/RlpB
MRRLGVLILSCAALLTTGCFYGFAGGGLPPHIHSLALSTFDNQSASPDVPKELFDELHLQLQRRLGVRDAPTDRADAAVKGTITSYDADIPVGFSANPQQALTAQRHLQITVSVEIIDQSNGKVLYSNKALRQEADYAERAEADGRRKAIQKIVQTVIEGVQSNW